MSNYTLTSSYILFDNGAFGLRYEMFGEGAYTGSYRQEDGRIIFDFAGFQSGEADAIATLNGDLFEVRYSLQMWLTDFEHAVYRRTQ